MSNALLILAMLLAGVVFAIQPSINARLAEKTGFMEASTISFAVGTLALLILSFLTSQGSFRRAWEANWWELTGGFCGAFIVTMTIVAVPRLGTTAVLALAIVSQLTTGLVMDHYGLFGMRGIPIDSRRALGVVLLLAGVLLVVKR